jgi:hypothetical protein
LLSNGSLDSAKSNRKNHRNRDKIAKLKGFWCPSKIPTHLHDFLSKYSFIIAKSFTIFFCFCVWILIKSELNIVTQKKPD